MVGKWQQVERKHSSYLECRDLGQKQALVSGSGIFALSPEAGIRIVNINVC
jgi:hypothetical protein